MKTNDPHNHQEKQATSDARVVDRKRRHLLAAGAGLGILAGLSSGKTIAQSSYGVEGQSAAEIKLDYWIDESGGATEFSVHAQRGKWVFLKCFQNWCPGCHSSGFPTLQKFSAEFHNHPKVAIAGIQTVFEGFGSNTRDDVRKLQLRYDLPIIMGHDPGDKNAADGDHRSQTMKLYRTGGTPWLILINPEGVVVYNHFKVDPDELIDYVRASVA